MSQALSNPTLLWEVAVADLKYTVQSWSDGRLNALRYGQPWQELSGNNLIYALAAELRDTRMLVESTLPLE